MLTKIFRRQSDRGGNLNPNVTNVAEPHGDVQPSTGHTPERRSRMSDHERDDAGNEASCENDNAAEHHGDATQQTLTPPREKGKIMQEKRGQSVKLRTINVIDDIDVVVTEDWQNSKGDVVTYTVKPNEEVRDLRILHLRKGGKSLLSVVITDEQFNTLNGALSPQQ